MCRPMIEDIPLAIDFDNGTVIVDNSFVAMIIVDYDTPIGIRTKG